MFIPRGSQTRPRRSSFSTGHVNGPSAPLPRPPRGPGATPSNPTTRTAIRTHRPYRDVDFEEIRINRTHAVRLDRAVAGDVREFVVPTLDPDRAFASAVRPTVALHAYPTGVLSTT